MHIKRTSQGQFSNSAHLTRVAVTLAGGTPLSLPVGAVVGNLPSGPSVMSFANNLSSSPNAIATVGAKCPVVITFQLALTAPTETKTLLAVLKNITARVKGIVCTSIVNRAPLGSALDVAKMVGEAFAGVLRNQQRFSTKVARYLNAIKSRIISAALVFTATLVFTNDVAKMSLAATRPMSNQLKLRSAVVTLPLDSRARLRGVRSLVATLADPRAEVSWAESPTWEIEISSTRFKRTGHFDIFSASHCGNLLHRFELWSGSLVV